MLTLSKYFTCNLIETFYFANAEHFWLCLVGIFITIDNNYKLLIMFDRVNVYLNEPVKIDKLINLANQSIMSTLAIETFWKQKISLSFEA